MSSLYSKYEKSTITKFDIIGSYFVGIYYNELYLKAEQLRDDGKYDSLTQAYQNVLYTYIQFTQTKDFFRKTILGIHNYFISTTKFVSMTYKECIDFIVSEFIPTHLFGNVKEARKYSILNNILIDCLKIFTERILQKQIVPIIDNHSQEANISILQNLFLDIILLEKDKMYARFINPEKRNHMIPAELYTTIQVQLKKLSESNKKLLTDNMHLKKNLEHITNLAESETNRLKKLGLEVVEQNKQLTNEKNILLQKLDKYENNLSVVSTQQYSPKNIQVEQEQLNKSRQEQQFKLEQEQLNKSRQEQQFKLEQEQLNKSRQEQQFKLEQEQLNKSRQEQQEQLNKSRQEQQFKLEPSAYNSYSASLTFSDSGSDKSVNQYPQFGQNLIKQELNEKQEEFLNEMNDDDVSGFVSFA
jgi:hypothetical protein